MVSVQDAYVGFTYAKDWTAKSRKFYDERLGLFFAWLPVTQVDAITADLVRRYVAHRREKETLSQGTLRADVRAIKSFLNWCVREDLLDPKIPARIEMPKRVDGVIEVFTPLQLAAFLASAASTKTPSRDTAIILVLLDTGLRAFELCGLTLDQLFMGVDGAYLRINGKGRKEREVGLGKKTRAALQRYLARERPKTESRAVFLSKRGGHLTPLGLDKLIYRLVASAGAEKFKGVRCSAHTFRHTFAVSYLREGGDIYKLSRLMGHSSVAITEVYLRALKASDARSSGTSVVDAVVRTGAR